ncbi:MAG: LysM peptidoglycan-binding domain-containing protein [Bacteroidia bacterium]|nr:LysM peptidoglycan-binding domain-containing protein [Bacteroidia bacterium]
MNLQSAFILILAATGLSSTAFAQLKKANRHFKNQEYATAIPLYKEALAKDSSAVAMENLAACYRELQLHKDAEYWYSRVVKKGIGLPTTRLYYGQELRANGKYEEAKKQLQEFLKAVPNHTKAAKLIKSCDYALEVTKGTAEFSADPVNKLNTRNSEMAPVRYRKGISFTSSREGLETKKFDKYTGQPYYDVYYADINAQNEFKTPQPFPAVINDKYHDGPATFDSTGRKVYFTRSLRKKGNPDLMHSIPMLLGIFYSEFDGAEWSKPKPFPFNSKSYSVGHPCLLPGGKELIFVSDMPGGYGGTDLYITKLTADGWSTPTNLGPVINTEGNEMFPSVGSDGTLYFASDLHPGLGGLDMFSATRSGAVWGNVTNLKMGFNSSFDEIGILMSEDKEFGYVASNRPGGKGGDDIFYVYRTQKKDTAATVTVVDEPQVKPFTISGTVSELKMKQIGLDEWTRDYSFVSRPVKNATVVLLNDKEELNRVITSDDGKFAFNNIDKRGNYVVIAKQDSFWTNKLEFNTARDIQRTEFSDTLFMERVQLNQKTSKLVNVYYGYNDTTVIAEDEKKLIKMTDVLKENPKLKIQISSYADPTGLSSYNLDLSRKRSLYVRNFFERRDINPKRLINKGFGATNFIVKGTKDKIQNQPNRRTEFMVISLDFEKNDPKTTFTPTTTIQTTTTVAPKTNTAIEKLTSDNFYIVKTGETLFKIAKKFNTSVEELVKLNNLKSFDVQVGQKLRVK